MDADALLAVLLALLLVLANGFFVAAEYAFVRVRSTQVDELAAAGSARAKLVKRIEERLDKYISPAQLGVTGASLAIGWIGEPAVAAIVSPLFTRLPQPDLHGVALAIALPAITYGPLVVREVAPKDLAIP